MRDANGGKDEAASGPRATVVTGVAEEAVPGLFGDAARSSAGFARALADLRSNALALAATPALGLPALSRVRSAPELTEHSTMHVALEGISLLASRIVQDNRMVASVVPTDLSSGDVPVDLPGIAEPLRAKVSAASRALHAARDTLISRAAEQIAARDRCSVDQARAPARAMMLGLVPTSTRTSVYFSASARVLAMHCSKLLAHPHAEVRTAGRAILEAARATSPAHFLDVEPSRMRAAIPVEVRAAMARLTAAPQEGSSATMVISQPVRLVRHDKDALERVMLALAYDSSDPIFNAFALMGSLRSGKDAALLEVLRAVLRERLPGELFPRGFEVTGMTFEIMADAATMHDLLRHRCHSAVTQRLTCRLGFQLPEDLIELGLVESYQDAMLSAQAAWSELEAQDPYVAEYVVPLGYRVRSLWTVDLRQLLHIIESRSGRSNPTRVRRIAHALYRTAAGVLPWLRDLCRVDLD